MKEMCLCTIGTLVFGSGLILSAMSTTAVGQAEVSAQGPAKSPYAQRRLEQAGVKKQVSAKRDPYAARAKAIPQGGIAGPCPNPDHDCCTTGTPGCSDGDCCTIVCGLDAFCCNTAWDSICVGGANTNCGGGNYCFQPPSNNTCAERIPIFDGETPFHTIGATTDGPTHPLCDQFSFPGIDNDIWFNYTATQSGDLCIQTCGSGYDTKVAVYALCGCPVSDANILACNDDTCGLQSQVVVSVSAGNCYKIRVGGYIGASGEGIITITPGGCPVNQACPNPKHDCCTQGGPGCSDEACCAAVCAADPFCCDVAWDGLCVNAVDTLCAKPCPPPCPNPKHDCQTEGGPGCSDEECCLLVCAIDPFCCDVAWDSICVGESAICIDCDPICPPDAVQEGEPCGSDTNGGCNSTPPVYTQISCGDVVCGEYWALGGTRDTDWYQFSVSEDGTEVTWSVEAQFPATAAFILNNDCGNIVLIATGEGFCPTVATASGCAALNAGTYVAFAATSGFDGLPCGGGNNAYVATLTCQAPCPTDLNGDGTTGVPDLLEVIVNWGACP